MPRLPNDRRSSPARRPGHVRVVAVLGLVVGVGIAGPAAGAPNDLDASFGTGGRLFLDNILQGLGEDGTELSALRVLADGRLVVSAYERCSLSCPPALVLARYTPAGAPDPTLAAGEAPGVLRISGGSGVDSPERDTLIGVALAPDGGAVTGRSTTAGGSMQRFDPRGAAGSPVLTSRPIVPGALRPRGQLLGLADRHVLRLTSQLVADPAFGGGQAVVLPAALTRRERPSRRPARSSAAARIATGWRSGAPTRMERAPPSASRGSPAERGCMTPSRSWRFRVAGRS